MRSPTANSTHRKHGQPRAGERPTLLRRLPRERAGWGSWLVPASGAARPEEMPLPAGEWRGVGGGGGHPLPGGRAVQPSGRKRWTPHTRGLWVSRSTLLERWARFKGPFVMRFQICVPFLDHTAWSLPRTKVFLW